MTAFLQVLKIDKVACVPGDEGEKTLAEESELTMHVAERTRI